jgi:anti-anti-sigma factor
LEAACPWDSPRRLSSAPSGYTSHAGKAAVIILAGELDLSNAERLLEVIRQVIGAGATELTLDVADVSFIDSTGISVFLTAYKWLMDSGGTLSLLSPTATVERTLHIAGVLGHLTVVRGGSDPNATAQS